MSSIIGLDLETHLISYENMCPKPVCMSLYDENESYLYKYEDMEKVLKKIFQNEVIIVGHNIRFDMSVIAKYIPNLKNIIWEKYSIGKIICTKVRGRLLDIARLGYVGKSYSLETLMKKYFDKLINKTEWRLNYSELENIPLDKWPEGAKNYAIQDAIYPIYIYLYQQLKAEEIDYKAFELESTRQSAIDYALQWATYTGIAIDKDRVLKLAKETSSKISKPYEILKKEGIIRENGTKNKKLTQSLIKKTLGSKTPYTPHLTKSQIKTDKDTIKKCTDNPILKAYSDYMQLSDICTKYLFRLLELGDVAYPGFNILVATGRTSSYAGNYGVQIQNQPRKVGIRECYKARDGYAFVMADYDCQELRTLGEVCKTLLGYSTLADKFIENIHFDPHLNLGAKLAGIPLKEAEKRYKNRDPEIKKWRQRAKACNFGFPGGLGAETFCTYAEGYNVKVSILEAKNLKNQWFGQWPEMKAYFSHVNKIIETGKIHQLGSNRIRGRCGFCDGANTYFQGLASDVSKTAFFLTVRDLCNEEIKPVWFIHDEIGLEVRLDKVDYAAKKLVKIMEKAGKIYCKHVPLTASAIAMYHWSKKAEPTYREGKLIPWEPCCQ